MINVVITGSTRGLGLEMAKRFLEEGCNVTISGSKPESFGNAKEKLRAFNEKYIYITCNVRNKEDIRNLLGKSLDKWGSVDIWINNAG